MQRNQYESDTVGYCQLDWMNTVFMNYRATLSDEEKVKINKDLTPFMKFVHETHGEKLQCQHASDKLF